MQGRDVAPAWEPRNRNMPPPPHRTLTRAMYRRRHPIKRCRFARFRDAPVATNGNVPVPTKEFSNGLHSPPIHSSRPSRNNAGVITAQVGAYICIRLNSSVGDFFNLGFLFAFLIVSLRPKEIVIIVGIVRKVLYYLSIYIA